MPSRLLMFFHIICPLIIINFSIYSQLLEVFHQVKDLESDGERKPGNQIQIFPSNNDDVELTIGEKIYRNNLVIEITLILFSDALGNDE